MILQHHFIFEHIDLRTDRNLSSSSRVTPTSTSTSTSESEGEGEEVNGSSDRHINELERVYSDQRPILNPAELADMEVMLGSKAGEALLYSAY